MIAFVKGPLVQIEEDMVVVEAGSVGLEIRVPLPVLEQLPAVGETVMLYTYFQVKEDGMSLYGFLNRQDRAVFKQLLSVNGVGPKGALGILSVLRPDDLRLAVLSGDVKAISKAPGIGTKTAQRVILDLKDKVSMEQVTEGWMEGNGAGRQTAGGGAGAADLSGAAREAVQALTALGYTSMEAARAVKKVELQEGMTAEEVLKASLRHLSFL